MLRTLLAIVAGVVVAGAATFVVELVGHQLYPPPDEIVRAMAPDDPLSKEPPLTAADRQELMRQGIAKVSVGGFASVLLAWLCGAALGAFVVGWLAPSAQRVAVGVFAIIYFALCAFNLLLFPGPLWFTLLGVLVPWLGASGGWQAASRLRPAAPTAGT